MTESPSSPDGDSGGGEQPPVADVADTPEEQTQNKDVGGNNPETKGLPDTAVDTMNAPTEDDHNDDGSASASASPPHKKDENDEVEVAKTMEKEEKGLVDMDTPTNTEGDDDVDASENVKEATTPHEKDEAEAAKTMDKDEKSPELLETKTPSSLMNSEASQPPTLEVKTHEAKAQNISDGDMNVNDKDAAGDGDGDGDGDGEQNQDKVSLEKELASDKLPASTDADTDLLPSPSKTFSHKHPSDATNSNVNVNSSANAAAAASPTDQQVESVSAETEVPPEPVPGATPGSLKEEESESTMEQADPASTNVTVDTESPSLDAATTTVIATESLAMEVESESTETAIPPVPEQPGATSGSSKQEESTMEQADPTAATKANVATESPNMEGEDNNNNTNNDVQQGESVSTETVVSRVPEPGATSGSSKEESSTMEQDPVATKVSVATEPPDAAKIATESRDMEVEDNNKNDDNSDSKKNDDITNKDNVAEVPLPLSDDKVLEKSAVTNQDDDENDNTNENAEPMDVDQQDTNNETTTTTTTTAGKDTPSVVAPVAVTKQDDDHTTTKHDGNENAEPMDVDQKDTNNETTTTTTAGKDTPAVVAPAPVVPAVSSGAKTLSDTFDALAQRQGGASHTVTHRRRPPKGPKLQIVLSSAVETTATTQAKQKATSSPTRRRMESKVVEAPALYDGNESGSNNLPTDQDDDINVDAWNTTDYDMQEEMEQELEDSLRFFQETHEDQDASYCLLQKELDQEARKRKIKELSDLDKKGRQEIDDVINEQMKERQIATEKSVERYRQRLAQDEKRDTVRLNLLLHQKSNSNQTKINQGIKILQRRHQKEMQSALQHHRQQAQQRRLPEQMAASEWQSKLQQIQAKQQRQLQEFGGKGEELKKKTENDFKREQEKLRNNQETRLKEIESNKQKIFAKLYAGLQQLRQRYLKRHLQNMMKMKEELLQTDSGEKEDGERRNSQTQQSSSSARDLVKSAMEEKIELRPASPIKSIPEWAEHLPYEQAGGATRHKNRKSVMSQASRQLSVEIHNEGLWISLIKPSSDDDDSKNRASAAKKEQSSDNVDQHFIPFGLKAHSILESIVCGEIPDGYDRFDFGDSLALQGGQIRCVVADLRTSEDTASSHRALAMQEQEESNMAELEKKVADLNTMATEAETAMTRTETEKQECIVAVDAAVKELEKAKRMLEEFKTKFRNFLSADGTPIPTANPSDRQELLKAMSRYKNNLESTSQREKTVRQALSDTKARLLKYQTVGKTAQKNASLATTMLKKKKAAVSSAKVKGARPVKLSEAAEQEKAAARVKDVIAALQKTAARRRDQSNQKKSSSVSSAWIQSFPGLSNSLKKSLWHRIHRRKQQIVLRPTPECLVNELRASVADNFTAGVGVRSSQKKAALEEELVKAEQMYLVATHPIAEVGLPSVPPSRSTGSWGEPGWQLVLDVPQKPVSHHSILPCAPSFPVLEKNLSDICSAPGRQAASMVRTSYLRCLASPLSSFAIASSPAEINASLSLSRKSDAT
jgi:hypothetical protein